MTRICKLFSSYCDENSHANPIIVSKSCTLSGGFYMKSFHTVLGVSSCYMLPHHGALGWNKVRSCLKFLAILKRLDFQGAVSGFCLPIGGYFGSFLRFSRQIARLSSFGKRGKRQCKPSAMQTERSSLHCRGAACLREAPDPSKFPPDGLNKQIQTASKSCINQSASTLHALTQTYRKLIMQGLSPLYLAIEPILQVKPNRLPFFHV